MSSWEHSCKLDASTLQLLFVRQGAYLRTLFCTRVSSSDSIVASLPRALYSVSAESIEPYRNRCEWEAAVITINAATLNHLRLGFISRIAHDFAIERRPLYDNLLNQFSDTMNDYLFALNLNKIHLCLGSLHLCGLNLGSVLQGKMGLDIDFTKITHLRLESCPELSQAFSLLMDPAGSSRSTLYALQDLFIRFENPDAQFSKSLESFLTSIRGLIHLRVLIDKASAAQDLEPILDVHGKTLRTLVWDERSGPRTDLDASTSLLLTGRGIRGILRIVSQKCHSLTTLGMALDWNAAKNKPLVIESYLRKMPCLETLNIRNLPGIRGRPIMPMDYYAKGLAAMIVDSANESRKSSLRTIAIGAPFYRDIYVGTHHVIHTSANYRLNDLLSLRVYSIDYNYLSPSGLSPVLSQIIKGAAYSSEEELYPKDLLYDYWLG